MKAFHILLFAGLLCAGAASADEEPPESCRPKVAGTAPTLSGEAEKAQLQCDIDRANHLVARSARLQPTTLHPAIRIVDTASPSGAAYIYDVIGTGPSYWLEARSVPSEGNERSRVPVCKLSTALPDDVAKPLVGMLATIGSIALPEYGRREEVTINPDGSRRVVLLLDTHDIVTTIETPGKVRHFSRHAKASDDIARINQMIISVANISAGWTCNAN
ncbi:hypothetical protein [Hyphomonas sp.]|jgi:hypothetical protein|uniref:hypothetical protein n=1 Tax=Hyphomonas sp. TaxID=87 RepID=UPI0039E40B51